jgi:hypothetical protein
MVCANTTVAIDPSTATCVLCGELYPHCSQCNNRFCTACARFYTLSGSGECVCEVEGTCFEITGCTVSFLNSSLGEECLKCNSTSFYSAPVNNECICLNGTLVNGICTTTSGCLSPATDSSG